MAWAWMGVGVTRFASETARRTGSARPRFEKEVKLYLSWADVAAAGGAACICGEFDIPRGLGCPGNKDKIGLSRLRRFQEKLRAVSATRPEAPVAALIAALFLSAASSYPHGRVDFKACGAFPSSGHATGRKRRSALSSP